MPVVRGLILSLGVGVCIFLIAFVRPAPRPVALELVPPRAAPPPAIVEPSVTTQAPSPVPAPQVREPEPAPAAVRTEEVATPVPAVEEGEPRKDPSAKLFAPGSIPHFDITLTPAAWNALERNPREYVEATVVVDGKKLERVGVHLKGAAGSYQPLGAHPALTLKVNEFVKGQKYRGLTKLHLNNSVQDPTYLHERIAGELFLAAGVPAARATQARVVLNGRDLGIHVLKEALDRRFLRRHFKDDSGNLYDGGFCQDVYQRLENDTHRESTDQSDLKALVKASQEPDLAMRWQHLGEVLDLERFARYLVLEVLLWDWDGYALKPNNYRVYHDPQTDRLVFLPHGMDQLFAQPEAPISPSMGGIVARAFVSTPEGRALYRARLRELTETLFRVELLDRQVLDVRTALVEAALQGKRRDTSLAARIDQLRQILRARVRSVERQLLEKPAQPLALDAGGKALLGGQRWYPEKDTGGVEASERTEPNGARQLVVDSHGNRCLGSWRCRVLLEPGLYRLSCRARTEGVVPLSDKKGAGAGLRLGGTQSPRANSLVGDSAWSELVHELEVASAEEEVELVCELRALQGKVTFDRASLAVQRLSRRARR